MTSKIILKCVQVGSKLRIRFHSFVNEKGETFLNVYDNSYNCQFPKAIRRAGCYYEISASDMVLVASGGKQPFYSVKNHNIKVLTGKPGDDVGTELRHEMLLKTFAVLECVVCMENAPDQAFVPCGHACICKGCYTGMKQAAANSYHRVVNCPLCRTVVTNTLPYVPVIEPATPASIAPSALTKPLVDITGATTQLAFEDDSSSAAVATDKLNTGSSSSTTDSTVAASTAAATTAIVRSKKPKAASRKPNLASVAEVDSATAELATDTREVAKADEEVAAVATKRKVVKRKAAVPAVPKKLTKRQLTAAAALSSTTSA